MPYPFGLPYGGPTRVGTLVEPLRGDAAAAWGNGQRPPMPSTPPPQTDVGQPVMQFASDPMSQLARKNWLFAGGGKTDAYGNPIIDTVQPRQYPEGPPPQQGGGGGGGFSGSMGQPAPRHKIQGGVASGSFDPATGLPVPPTTAPQNQDPWKGLNAFHAQNPNLPQGTPPAFATGGTALGPAIVGDAPPPQRYSNDDALAARLQNGPGAAMSTLDPNGPHIFENGKPVYVGPPQTMSATRPELAIPLTGGPPQVVGQHGPELRNFPTPTQIVPLTQAQPVAMPSGPPPGTAPAVPSTGYNWTPAQIQGRNLAFAQMFNPSTRAGRDNILKASMAEHQQQGEAATGLATHLAVVDRHEQNQRLKEQQELQDKVAGHAAAIDALNTQGLIPSGLYQQYVQEKNPTKRAALGETMIGMANHQFASKAELDKENQRRQAEYDFNQAHVDKQQAEPEYDKNGKFTGHFMMRSENGAKHGVPIPYPKEPEPKASGITPIPGTDMAVPMINGQAIPLDRIITQTPAGIAGHPTAMEYSRPFAKQPAEKPYRVGVKVPDEKTGQLIERPHEWRDGVLVPIPIANSASTLSPQDAGTKIKSIKLVK